MHDESQPPLSAEEAEYYYHGFRRILRRFGVMSVLGWGIVLVGFTGLLFAWNQGLPHELIDILLALSTIVAGVLVVQQAVTGLQEYLSLPRSPAEGRHPAVAEIQLLMSDLRRGGWREARKGTSELERIASRHQISGERHVQSVFKDQ